MTLLAELAELLFGTLLIAFVLAITVKALWTAFIWTVKVVAIAFLTWWLK